MNRKVGYCLFRSGIFLLLLCYCSYSAPIVPSLPVSLSLSRSGSVTIGASIDRQRKVYVRIIQVSNQASRFIYSVSFSQSEDQLELELKFVWLRLAWLVSKGDINIKINLEMDILMYIHTVDWVFIYLSCFYKRMGKE